MSLRKRPSSAAFGARQSASRKTRRIASSSLSFSVSQSSTRDFLLPQLVVQRLAVIQMQRLRYARFLLPFAGTGLASLGPAEGVEELRDELRIGKLQSAVPSG